MSLRLVSTKNATSNLLYALYFYENRSRWWKGEFSKTLHITLYPMPFHNLTWFRTPPNETTKRKKDRFKSSALPDSNFSKSRSSPADCALSCSARCAAAVDIGCGAGRTAPLLHSYLKTRLARERARSGGVARCEAGCTAGFAQRASGRGAGEGMRAEKALRPAPFPRDRAPLKSAS